MLGSLEFGSFFFIKIFIRLTLVFCFDVVVVYSNQRLGCFSIRLRMLFDRVVDLDLFLFLTSSIILHLVVVVVVAVILRPLPDE